MQSKQVKKQGQVKAPDLQYLGRGLNTLFKLVNEQDETNLRSGRLIRAVSQGDLVIIEKLLSEQPNLSSAVFPFKANDYYPEECQEKLMTGYQFARWSGHKPMAKLFAACLTPIEIEKQQAELESRVGSESDDLDMGIMFDHVRQQEQVQTRRDNETEANCEIVWKSWAKSPSWMIDSLSYAVQTYKDVESASESDIWDWADLGREASDWKVTSQGLDNVSYQLARFLESHCIPLFNGSVSKVER